MMRPLLPEDLDHTLANPVWNESYAQWLTVLSVIRGAQPMPAIVRTGLYTNVAQHPDRIRTPQSNPSAKG